MRHTPTRRAHRRSSLQTAVRLARSVFAYVVVSLYVLVVGPLAILLGLLVRHDAVLYLPGRFGVRMALALVGIRSRVAGREHVPSAGVVFCANHQSNVDPPVLFAALPDRLRMLYKVEFDRIPILAQAIRLAGFIPIDRRDRAQAVHAIQRAATSIREQRRSFLIFAEGTRSRTGELLPFKKGGFIMAILAQAPIVPVAISGAREAMQKGSAIINPVSVTVRIGQAIETRGLTMNDRDALMLTVRARIEQLLADGPIESIPARVPH